MFHVVRRKAFLGKRAAVIPFFILLFFASSAVAADWTILIFMNGKNNLEDDAIANFEDMASIGSTSKVNIVAELGRPKVHVSPNGARLYGGWSGVYRFHIKENTTPLPQFALSVPGRGAEDTVDMGDPDVLRDFLTWGKEQFPADRYMVVIWNHGQGWRAQSPVQIADASPPPAGAGMTGGFRAVSYDDDTGNFLYNADVTETVGKVFATGPDKKLDLLGFDACFMSMIETAYAVRDSVKTMVASAELEPGAGWPYSRWLSQLVKNPALDEVKLARLVVNAYKKQYKDSQHTTLSVVDPAKSAATASALSQLVVELISKLPQERGNLDRARRSIIAYGNWRDARNNTSVDVITFLEKYQKLTRDPKLKELTAAALAGFKGQVLYNYSSRVVVNGASGGKGMAIYFPASKANFDADPYASGYLKINDIKPVDFVREHSWADFLSIYLQ